MEVAHARRDVVGSLGRLKEGARSYAGRRFEVYLVFVRQSGEEAVALVRVDEVHALVLALGLRLREEAG